MNQVDLRELAVDRGGGDEVRVRMRRHVLSQYVVPAVLILGFAALIVWSSWEVVFPPKPVTVVPVWTTQADVGQEGTPLFNAAGWIEPRPTPVRVAALAPGVVEQLLVVEDQPVKPGEPVAKLVKEDAELSYQKAQADFDLRQAEAQETAATLAAAKTRFEQPVHLQATLSDSEAALAKMETQLKNLPFETRRAQADLEVARQDYEGKVSAQGVVAGVEIDRSKGKLDSAKALVEELGDRADSLNKERTALIHRRDALKTQLELLADEIKAKDEAEARLKAAMARVAQARVVVAEAKLQLDRMVVRSPIAGRVYQLIGHPGTRLAAGMGPDGTYDGSTVVTLYRPNMLQVRVDVRFQDLPHVSLGQPVRINNPALASPISGKVLFVSSEADIQKNTLQVKVEIDVPSAVFKPEMLVDVTFLAPADPKHASEPLQESQHYLPIELVRRDDGGTFVWVADQSAGQARKTPVQVGRRRAGHLVEITSGLSVSSRIIAAGGEGLRDGDRIRVTGEEPSVASDAAIHEDGGGHSTLHRLPTGDGK